MLVAASPLFGRADDSTQVRIPDIRYHSLDSLIRTAPFTGIFFWSGWCSGCAAEFPKLLEAVREKRSISFYSINDPDTRPLAPKSRYDHPDILKGYYRIQRYGRNPAFAINDFTQQRYFLWYYTKRTDRAELKQTLSFLLLDQTGKLVYASRYNVTVDSVKKALASFE